MPEDVAALLRWWWHGRDARSNGELKALAAMLLRSKLSSTHERKPSKPIFPFLRWVLVLGQQPTPAVLAPSAKWHVGHGAHCAPSHGHVHVHSTCACVLSHRRLTHKSGRGSGEQGVTWSIWANPSYKTRDGRPSRDDTPRNSQAGAQRPVEEAHTPEEVLGPSEEAPVRRARFAEAVRTVIANNQQARGVVSCLSAVACLRPVQRCL